MKQILLGALLLISVGSKAQLISLCGIWYTHEYACTPYIPTETFYIVMQGDSAICTKIIGDSCVTSGHVSWIGVYDATIFSIVIWGGAPGNPNSTTSNAEVEVMDSMWFTIGSIDVYRYSCFQLDSMGMDPSDYGLPCTCGKSSGISIASTFYNNIYPNPTTSTIHLQSSTFSSHPTTISIFNLLSQKMKEEKVSGSDVTIDVSELPEGLYVVRTEEKLVGKFVKE